MGELGELNMIVLNPSLKASSNVLRSMARVSPSFIPVTSALASTTAVNLASSRMTTTPSFSLRTNTGSMCPHDFDADCDIASPIRLASCWLNTTLLPSPCMAGMTCLYDGYFALMSGASNVQSPALTTHPGRVNRHADLPSALEQPGLQHPASADDEALLHPQLHGEPDQALLPLVATIQPGSTKTPFKGSLAPSSSAKWTALASLSQKSSLNPTVSMATFGASVHDDIGSSVIFSTPLPSPTLISKASPWVCRNVTAPPPVRDNARFISGHWANDLHRRGVDGHRLPGEPEPADPVGRGDSSAPRCRATA